MSLTVNNLSLKKGPKTLLNQINCQFEAGVVSAVIGTNGSGKSLFVKALMGFEKASGTVDWPADAKVAYIPQTTVTDDYFTVFEYVLLGLYGQLSWQVSPGQIKKVNQTLSSLNLLDLSEQKVGQLSGGQQQLVVLAQALVREPNVIIADEPTSALDIHKQLEYLTILSDYIHQHQVTGIVVIHDLTLAARFSDQVYLMAAGQLSAGGSPDRAFEQERLEALYNVDVELVKTRDQQLAVIPLSARGED